MNIVIAGAGRVGARLSRELAGPHEVTVLDADPAAFRRLPVEFEGNTIVGNATEIDVLREARVESADVFIAVTDSDNCNLMAAQIAKTVLGVPQVVARVYDPVRGEIFRDMGLTVVSPTVTSAERLYERIVSAPANVRE